jgi:hypothetical protein
LRVRVTIDGAPAANRDVVWEAAQGQVNALASSRTDADGVASADFRFGVAGPEAILVRLSGDTTAATFSLTGLQAAGDPPRVGELPIPPDYGIHDTFVRDGVAFVCAWNTGVIILDVGDGRKGGSPSNPIEIARLVTEGNDVPGGPAVHNAWWFHNPVSQEKRYLFVGQEGPATVGATSAGDIHVVDVSDLANPREVASLRIPGGGTHNFWMDEASQTLYAAYYNAGVIAVDVSGTLQGDLTSRVRARVMPGGPGNTFVWGVQVANGAVWASDMVSGLWKLDPTTLLPVGGGNNVPERWGADLWVHGPHAYTGTWGGSPRQGAGVGNAVKIWRVDGAAPELVDSLIIPDVRTVSDVQVSDDGALLVVTTERLAGQGLLIYDLLNPERPQLSGRALVPTGLHTGTVSRIGGRLFVFAARNPAAPALEVYDITP